MDLTPEPVKRGTVVQIEGARELRKQLRKAEADLSDLKDLHRKIGEIVFYATRPNRPKGKRKPPASRSRRLHQTLRYFPTRTSVRVMAGSKVVPYAMAIHWGRKVFPSQKSTYKYKHPAPFEGRPWIRKAAEKTEPEWTALFQAEIQKILDKIEGLGKEPPDA